MPALSYKSTIVRLLTLNVLAGASGCTATLPSLAVRDTCGGGERLVCESTGTARRCSCAEGAELERIFGGLGAAID